MHALRFVHVALATLFLLVPSTLAVPAATTTCKSQTTFTAGFQHRATDKPVPNGLGNVNWTNFTVTYLSLYYWPNSSHVAEILQKGSRISQSDAARTSNGYWFTLKEFSFGCLAPVPITGDEYPWSCSVLVTTSVTSTFTDEIVTYGPFDHVPSWDPDRESFRPANMTRVVFPAGVGAHELYFDVTAGPSRTKLYLDNLVIVNTNPACY